MKLYELGRGARFVIKEAATIPIASNKISENTQLMLHNIDGMYSYCTDDMGNAYHPAAYTEVEKIEQH